MTTPSDDLRLIIVRRGNMRVQLPMKEKDVFDTTPFEVAQAAVLAFLRIQQDNPGVADVPVVAVVGGPAMALALPGALGPLNPEMMLGHQLIGQWQDMEAMEAPVNLPKRPRTIPAVALNLIDTNAN